MQNKILISGFRNYTSSEVVNVLCLEYKNGLVLPQKSELFRNRLCKKSWLISHLTSDNRKECPGDGLISDSVSNKQYLVQLRSTV